MLSIRAMYTNPCAEVFWNCFFASSQKNKKTTTINWKMTTSTDHQYRCFDFIVTFFPWFPHYRAGVYLKAHLYFFQLTSLHEEEDFYIIGCMFCCLQNFCPKRSIHTAKTRSGFRRSKYAYGLGGIVKE